MAEIAGHQPRQLTRAFTAAPAEAPNAVLRLLIGSQFQAVPPLGRQVVASTCEFLKKGLRRARRSMSGGQDGGARRDADCPQQLQRNVRSRTAPPNPLRPPVRGESFSNTVGIQRPTSGGSGSGADGHAQIMNRFMIVWRPARFNWKATRRSRVAVERAYLASNHSAPAPPKSAGCKSVGRLRRPARRPLFQIDVVTAVHLQNHLAIAHLALHAGDALLAATVQVVRQAKNRRQQQQNAPLIVASA